GDTGDRNAVRLLFLRRTVEEVLDQAELPLPADERCLEALRLQRAARAGDNAQGTPEGNEPGFPFQLVAAGLLVRDGTVGRSSGRIADIDLTAWSGGLDASCGVDQVARDHALALGTERHRSFAGQDTGSRAQVLGAALRAGESQRSPTPMAELRTVSVRCAAARAVHLATVLNRCLCGVKETSDVRN